MNAVFESSTRPTSTLSTRRLEGGLCAEVIGYDFSVPPTEALTEEIKALADEHLVLLFRGQRLTEDQQVAFTKALGPIIPPPEKEFFGITNPLVMRLGNVDKEGNHLKPDTAAAKFQMSAETWHSDGSYYPTPNYLTVVHGLVMPPVGGETWFASMVAAYENLPSALKEFLEDRRMDHQYPHNPDKAKWYKGTEREVVSHPMVRRLAGGKKALFISPWGGKIHGVSDKESDEILAQLWDIATGPTGTVYRHKWQINDTIIWNNRGVVHAGQPYDRMKYPRLLQRAEVTDTEPFHAW